MDRPEWIAVHPQSKEVYCSLTNNSLRGKGKPLGGAEPLGADAANPRAPNAMGHIIRWREQDGDAAATRFSWDIFLLAGDPAHPTRSSAATSWAASRSRSPTAIVFDERGVLWIQTDASAQSMAGADWDRIGNNQMLAADPRTGEVRRFLTGPVGCEITGVTFAPGMRALFVNIQHPGEPAAAQSGRNDPNRPKAVSSWPDGDAGTRPRSATIVITRDDGGVIGGIETRDSLRSLGSPWGEGGRSRSRRTSAPLRGRSGSWGRRAGAELRGDVERERSGALRQEGGAGVRSAVAESGGSVVPPDDSKPCCEGRPDTGPALPRRRVERSGAAPWHGRRRSVARLGGRRRRR